MSRDRKSLIREYKEAPRPMGVGAVRNTVNGRLLVVAGTNIQALLNRHQAQLRLRGHPHKEMQREWNEFGGDAFRFEVLDTLTPSTAADSDPANDLRELEALWMEKLAPYEPVGYHRKPKTP